MQQVYLVAASRNTAPANLPNAVPKGNERSNLLPHPAARSVPTRSRVQNIGLKDQTNAPGFRHRNVDEGKQRRHHDLEPPSPQKQGAPDYFPAEVLVGSP